MNSQFNYINRKSSSQARLTVIQK